MTREEATAHRFAASVRNLEEKLCDPSCAVAFITVYGSSMAEMILSHFTKVGWNVTTQECVGSVYCGELMYVVTVK